MSGFLESCIRVLAAFVREGFLFSSMVELAEGHPEAVEALARVCRGLVEEALEGLRPLRSDEYVWEAYGRLEASLRILDVLAGDGAIRRKPVKPLLLLDLAHSHVHKAIDALERSETFRGQRRLLELLSEARRASAPKNVYQTVYRQLKKRKSRKKKLGETVDSPPRRGHSKATPPS